MKKINFYKVTIGLTLMTCFNISSLGDNLTSSTITDNNPRLSWDDTRTAGGPEWNFGMYSMSTGNKGFYMNPAGSGGDFIGYHEDENEIFWGADTFKFKVNTGNVFESDLNGDINLADGSVFIKKSENRMGIGTVTPEASLHIKTSSNSETILENLSAKWMTRVGGGTKAYYINDLTSGHYSIFRIEQGAPSYALKISSTGNIGFGTSSPTEAVDVHRVNSASRFQLTSVSNDSVNVAQFIQRRARDGGTAILRNDNMGQFSFRGHNGTDYTGTRAGIAVLSAENWSNGNEGTRMIFTVTKNGTSSTQHGLRIENNGDVYVPNGNLYVGNTKLNVPDYVFEKDYKLMPLTELSTYIHKNNHLPGIVSAKTVNKEGYVDMTQMQMNLLEKVEELTLYTLQQHSELISKDMEIKAMKEQINKLESMQKRLAKVESLLTNIALDTSNIKLEKVSLNTK